MGEVVSEEVCEHMVCDHMTHRRTEESRAASLWLKCNNGGSRSRSRSWSQSFECKSVCPAGEAGESSPVTSAQTQSAPKPHMVVIPARAADSFDSTRSQKVDLCVSKLIF